MDISIWMIILGIGLVVLLFWLVLWIALSPREYGSTEFFDPDSDEDEFPEALHETCRTRCGKGRVCESGVCKQEVYQPCSQDVDCAYGNSCVNWICGGKVGNPDSELISAQETDSDSDSETESRSSRRITFIDEP